MKTPMTAIAIALSAILAGCMGENVGSRTIVGNHCALPKLSNESTNTEFEIYESTEGAVVYTRRDSKVTIDFSNCYTNRILGIWDKTGMMKLTVGIEPLAVDDPEPQQSPSDTTDAPVQP